MVIVAVGAGDEVAAAAKGEVGDQTHAAQGALVGIERSQRAGIGAEPLSDFFGAGGAKGREAGGGGELGFAQLVIAAHQRQDRLIAHHQHQALHLRAGGQAGKSRHVVDGLLPGSGEGLGGEIAGRIGGGGREGRGGGAFPIGQPAAGGAGCQPVRGRNRAAARDPRRGWRRPRHPPIAPANRTIRPRAASAWRNFSYQASTPGGVHGKPAGGQGAAGKRIPCQRELLVAAQVAARNQRKMRGGRHAQLQRAQPLHFGVNWRAMRPSERWASGR